MRGIEGHRALIQRCTSCLRGLAWRISDHDLDICCVCLRESFRHQVPANGSQAQRCKPMEAVSEQWVESRTSTKSTHWYSKTVLAIDGQAQSFSAEPSLGRHDSADTHDIVGA